MNTASAATDPSISSIGSRRGALAGLLAVVAGVQTVRSKRKDRAKNKSKEKRRSGGSDNAQAEAKKRKGSKRRGTKPADPTVILVENSNNVTGSSGLVSGFAECPSGFVAVGGGFTIVGSVTTGLIAQELENAGRKWLVRFNVPSAPVGNASIEVVAVCLKAKLKEGG